MSTIKTVVLVSVLLMLGAVVNPATTKQVLLRVEGTPSAWSESRIDDLLKVQLSRMGSIQVRQVTDDQIPPFPQDSYNLDSLVNWGLESGGRYLFLVDVQREGLERRKDWVLPLIFHRWVTVGVIEGEMRFIDLARGRLVIAEPFRIERKAKGAFQGTMDDDANDPDLHLSAPEKVRFFAMLEQQLCDELIAKIPLLAPNGR
jgi:hypothetical protein